MKKMSAFILSLLLVFSAFPNIQAAEKLDWIDHHFSIELQIDGEWKQLEPVLYYSQENDVLADGLLMFHPIMEVIADIDVPTVTYYPEIDYRVSYDSYVERFRTIREIYKWDGEDVIDLEDDTPLFSELEPAKYLVCISCSGTHQGDDYAGACFFWLIVE